MSYVADSAVEANSVDVPNRRPAKIIIEDVVFDYHDFRTGNHLRALDSLSAEIGENEFFSILGPSGCGKSTLLFLIAGLLKPTKGRISVGGRAIKGPGADRGLVFQEYALLPWRTVRDNIALGPKIRGMRQAERCALAQRFIGLVGLSGFEDKFPHELSGGMRQRVAVARALCNSPEVILMDEPFAAVDAQTRAVLQDELTRIWAQMRLTVVFVTHNIDEAIFLGDEVMVMTQRPGKVHSIVPVEIAREERKWSILEEDPRFLALRSRISGIVRDLGNTTRDNSHV